MLRIKSKSKKRSTRSNTNGVPDSTDVLTLDEAAAYLRISTDEVVRSVDADGLPGRKVGGEWRFFKAAIQEWLSPKRQTGFLDELGKIKDDPHMEEMLREIYARRGRPEVE